jgi:thymidylate synthase (FAD)
MEIVEASVRIITPFSTKYVMSFLEYAGRIAHLSDDAITSESAEPFLRQLIKWGHESVLEHFHITVEFICDRGVTHEMVRHRIAAYTQESTRYCNYGKLGVKFIQPSDWKLDVEDLAMLQLIENHYNKCLAKGRSPQQARYFLPNGLKTKILVTYNIREWRHVLRLRTAKFAHPDIVAIMTPILDTLRVKFPVLFGDIKSSLDE